MAHYRAKKRSEFSRVRCLSIRLHKVSDLDVIYSSDLFRIRPNTILTNDMPKKLDRSPEKETLASSRLCSLRRAKTYWRRWRAISSVGANAIRLSRYNKRLVKFSSSNMDIIILMKVAGL